MARKPLQTYDVFVGNLPNDANERNVGKVFTPYGEIAGIIVKETSKVPPPYNKFAFVKFLCEPDAEKAVKELDKTNIQGSIIVVKKADDRKDQKKKSYGEGAGWRGFRQSDTGNLDSNAGEWTCPKLECANINFSRRTSCNLCSTPRPEGSISSDSSDVGGVVSAPGSIVEKELDTVLITHVETPITLWIQVVSDENTKKIFSITEQLIQLCPAAQPVSGQPDSGKVYACLFSEDNMWYRCQVKQNLGTDKFKIQYIDYGNTEEVTLSSLVELPASVANVKGLACKIQLHNTRAKDRSDKQGVLFLKSLTDNKMAQLVRTRPLADGSGYYGDLIINNFSLSDSMIQAGYCQSRPMMGKQSQMTRQQQNDTCVFPEVSGHQQLAVSSFSAVTKPQRDYRTVSSLGQPPSIIGPPSGQPPIGPTHMGFPLQKNQPDHGREKKLQNQLTKKNQEIERMRNEIDAAKMQAEYMRSKVKTLQEEFAASASRLQEDTMSRRISTSVALAGVVRNLREQFPTTMVPCLLEDAIALSMDKDRVDNSKCPSLSDVITSLARYKAAQGEISICKEQSELLDLIDTRNDSRRDLYKSLSTCLKEMEQLPVKTRSKQIQETQLRLMDTYSEYIKLQVHDVPSIENVAAGFKAWKEKKDTEFRDIRTATDFCEGALQTALNQVKERVSVQASSRTEKCDVDIDDLFKTYSHALQREINVTDMAHGKDASYVATLIASVRKDLQSEETTLENFSVLHQEFSSRKQTIEPWLDKTPSFSELQEVRKQIRSLKSKLRHIQADKLDLEESGDEGELDSIREEEDKVRTNLQTALLQSDNLLEEVAMLAESNFPELILQFPDFGIDTFLAYKGLVKTNREIDHYCLQPGFRPGVHISKYNQEPVLLQEFHIGDSEHCSKEEFMNQLSHYSGDTNIVQAVFFSKSDRLAYVQSHWDGGQLIETVVNSRQLTSEQLYKVCLKLTEQVVQIHASGCIHGEITPQSVIINEDNSVMLMYPDFSKQPYDRISKRYVAEGGLVFQTPELQYTSPEILGQTADVYNLVLLMFWLYCPNHNPSSLPDGGPSPVDLSPKMQQLFDAVISGKTATQIHANQVLTLLQETSPVQTEQSDFVPVSSAESMTIPQPHVIKSTNEPMEIGVFRAEDYITEQDILPPQPERSVNTALDTDNSWTTESSLSGTSGSRGDSPLDNTELEVKMCSDSLQSMSVDTARTDNSNVEISGNVSDTMAAVQTCDIHSCFQTDSALNTSSEILNIENVTGVTEKGAACEEVEKMADDIC